VKAVGADPGDARSPDPRTVSLEPKHGWAVAKRIEQGSGSALQVTQGALYPALHRIEGQWWLRAEWRETGCGREAKLYTLTAAGRSRLDDEIAHDEIAQWNRLSSGVDLVVRMA
jgi:PadR family transcriptional regulator, regulatory protein PadR